MMDTQPEKVALVFQCGSNCAEREINTQRSVDPMVTSSRR